MKIAIQISGTCLLVALAATASASLSATAQQQSCTAHATVSDPEPADCAFCGGNPAVHIRRLVDMERMNMAVFSSLAR